MAVVRRKLPLTSFAGRTVVVPRIEETRILPKDALVRSGRRSPAHAAASSRCMSAQIAPASSRATATTATVASLCLFTIAQ